MLITRNAPLLSFSKEFSGLSDRPKKDPKMAQKMLKKSVIVQVND